MSNAFGSLGLPALRKAVLGAGIQTEIGTLVGPGSRVAAYVRSGGPASGGDPDLNMRVVTTLNKGLAQCRSGMGDIVLVAHDHAENVSSADYMSSLVAGTRIVGLGYGNLRPTFTWSAAAATWLFDVANTQLQNCILKMAGPAGTTALSVAAPITISAAGCSIVNCSVQTSIDADQLATIPITGTDAADDLSIVGCQFYGATAGESTTIIDLLGSDRLYMADCHIEGATSSTTVGVVRFAATAATHITMERCTFINRKAASVHAVTGVASLSGVVRDCDFGILDNATLVGFVTPGDTMRFRCHTVNLAGEASVPSTVLSTV